MDNKQSILIFGGGDRQLSLIEQAKQKGLFTIVIDPDTNAYCKEFAHVFRVVKGNDFFGTINIAKRFNVKGIITSSTDKPLQMMARVAQELNLPFYSEETAVSTTDKLLMKKIFIKNNIPCALGVDISDPDDYEGAYPAIIKPRDTSGSRGVVLVHNKEELKNIFGEVIQFTKKQTVLVEEFIDGQEYSIESIHYDNKHIVLQHTKYRTTPFPYNAELEQTQPGGVSPREAKEINKLIELIGVAFNYNHCTSHTELKVTKSGDIYIIETSPRMGGGYIASHMVPMSTGINMEDLALDIALGKPITIPKRINSASWVLFLHCTPNIVINDTFFEALDEIRTIEGVFDVMCKLKKGDKVPYIKNGLDTYGHILLQAQNKEDLEQKQKKIKEILKKF